MKYREKVVDDQNVIFSADWINDLEDRRHFDWYYQQAECVYKNCIRDQNILEIGIGTGLLSDLLKKRGWKILTLDIDEEKRPDHCCNALDFDYGAYSIDVALAFEIFEHIPFKTFKKVICRLADCNVNKIYFSLPWCERSALEMQIKLPKLNRMDINISIPWNMIETPAHFWELSEKEKVLRDEKLLVRKETLKSVLVESGYQMASVKKVGRIEFFSASAENR